MERHGPENFKDTPPWEWPRGIGKKFLAILRDPQADAADRLLAADLAGDLVVINDALADALLAIVGNAAEPEELRAKAAISLGPVLEQADHVDGRIRRPRRRADQREDIS